MEDSLHFLLKTILKKENFIINFDELKLQLFSHPSYPSLHSITGVLGHFGIKNMALEVPKNRETLFQLPSNFISLISKENSQEFIIVNQQQNAIEILFGSKKKRNISIEAFLDIWEGIVVVVEKDDIKTSDANIDNKTIFKTLSFLTGLLILSTFFFFKPSFFESSHFILSLMGIWVSFLIIKHEFGFQSKALEKICTANETTSCDAVLNSKGASISNYFKLSDISIIYFTGLALSWILSISFSVSTNSIILFTLIALPITLYSLYYQYFIVKRWCPLCLGVVAILWLQCCTLFFDQTFISSIRIDFMSFFILFFSFLLTTSLWLFIKPLLKKQQELEKLEIEHYKFKRNFDLFNAVYSESESIDTSILDNKEIILGNKNALLNILMVTNPSCHFCKEAHIDLEKILKRNHDNVNAIIRFNVRQDKNNIANQVATRLLEIYAESEETCIEALHEVYKSDVNLNQWLDKWGACNNSAFSDILQLQQKWCHKNNINFTPALYIDGKQFPKEYNRSDLNYFIEDLIEREESNQIYKIESELV